MVYRFHSCPRLCCPWLLAAFTFSLSSCLLLPSVPSHTGQLPLFSCQAAASYLAAFGALAADRSATSLPTLLVSKQGGWRYNPVVESPCCLSRGLGFGISYKSKTKAHGSRRPIGREAVFLRLRVSARAVRCDHGVCFLKISGMFKAMLTMGRLAYGLADGSLPQGT